MGLAAREVSDVGRDDIVLPYAVEGLSTRGRLVRLGRGDRRHPQAPRLSRAGRPRGRRGGGARGAARLDAQDGRPLPVADQDFGSAAHAGGRFRRAVEFARPGALRRGGAGQSASSRAAKAICSAKGISPSPSIPAARCRAIRASSRWRARVSSTPRTPISSAPSKSRLWFASPSARASPRAASNGGRAGCSRSSCRIRRSGAATSISIPATRPRARPPRRSPETTTNGSKPRRAPRPPRTTSSSTPPCRASACCSACSTSAACASSSRRRLSDACRCSAERIDAMLQSFSAEERGAMIGDDGMIGVTCEFCSTKRIFNPADYPG